MFNTSMYGAVTNNGQPVYAPPSNGAPIGPSGSPPPSQFDLQEAFGQQQETTWTGKDYMQLFQGIGSLAMAGGKTFQDIYMASKIDPRNLNANINMNRQDAFANIMSTQNQNIDANIRQTGAVPQVYAPSTAAQAPKQDNTMKIFMGISLLLGAAFVFKK